MTRRRRDEGVTDQIGRYLQDLSDADTTPARKKQLAAGGIGCLLVVVGAVTAFMLLILVVAFGIAASTAYRNYNRAAAQQEEELATRPMREAQNAAIDAALSARETEWVRAMHAAGYTIPDDLPENGAYRAISAHYDARQRMYIIRITDDDNRIYNVVMRTSERPEDCAQFSGVWVPIDNNEIGRPIRFMTIRADYSAFLSDRDDDCIRFSGAPARR